MKKLAAPYLQSVSNNATIGEISFYLNKTNRYAIDEAPWPAYPYKPAAEFSIACNSDYIFLKYFVEETALRGLYSAANDPVHKDSCVEFFVSFDGSRAYYNFEFNCVGACLASYGNSRNDRIMMPADLIGGLKLMTAIDRSDAGKTGLIKWQLTVGIPVAVFAYNKIDDLRHTTARCNFYKCGDETEHPHFLCWNYIDRPEPDFHQPDFFGEVIFR